MVAAARLNDAVSVSRSAKLRVGNKAQDGLQGVSKASAADEAESRAAKQGLTGVKQSLVSRVNLAPSSGRSAPDGLVRPGALGAQGDGGKTAFSLTASPIRRAADNAVNLLILGAVIAGFITPVGHIALAVGLGLSMATSLPDWASKQSTSERRAASMLMGVSLGLAFGSVMAVLAVGTGPVGWTLSGLASAAMLARFGLLMYANRGRGMRHATMAALGDMLNLTPGKSAAAEVEAAPLRRARGAADVGAAGREPAPSLA